MSQTLNRHTERQIIESLKKLPPQQLIEVIRFIDLMVKHPRNDDFSSGAENIRNSVTALRGRGKGEKLVERLLRSRREDRDHDERKSDNLCY